MNSTPEEEIIFLMTLLEFILTQNFFILKDSLDLQLQGTAMGGLRPLICKPFPGLWEREVFLTHSIQYIEKVQLWTRYIDNFLMIWQGTGEELLSFTNSLNANDKNIKLTVSYIQDSVEFLDVKIFKDQDGYIQMDTFWKSTSVNALLHASSSHPASTKKGIPISQFIRICSNEHLFQEQARDLSSHFQERGYRKNIISNGLVRAENLKEMNCI